MAVTSTYSGQFLLELFTKEHDVENDSLIVCLMDTAFAFDPDTHLDYGDISANEIATGNGYTIKTKALSTVAAAYAAGTNTVTVTCDNVTWTASGGSIPAVGAAVVINDTHASDTVVCCIDFGADYTTTDTKLFQINFTSGLCNAVIG